ncbi:MAG: metallophosphoesterase [Halobacteriota archaeon]
MALVDPIRDAPAATADLGDETALVVADYHAGVEEQLRRDGVEIRSRGPQRRERVRGLVDRTDADRVVFLGDLGNHIGEPSGAELEELMDLEHDLMSVDVTLVPGNHDGRLGDVLDFEVVDGDGVVFGSVGFVHGHSWPSEAVLEADVLAVGHEHPTVRLADEVGGSRIERVWLRGPLSADPFEDRWGRENGPAVHGDLVVFPAFNDLVGGTWVNVDEQEFLSPFLPAASPDADAYLLDGTRLGPYWSV